jgi:hypothetical protein
MKRIEIVPIQRQAITEIGIENAPRCQGPFSNLFLPVILRRMGIPYDI